jgi:hypothetical protein
MLITLLKSNFKIEMSIPDDERFDASGGNSERVHETAISHAGNKSPGSVSSHDAEEMKFKVSSVIAVGFMCAAMFCNIYGYSLIPKDYKDTNYDDSCPHTRRWMSYGFLYQYVAFAGFVLSRAHRPKKTFVDSVVVSFLIFELLYHSFYIICWIHCENIQDYVQDSFQQFLSYPLSTILVSIARYDHHKHFHLETLFLLSLVLTGEITQMIFEEGSLDQQGMVLTYYNIKIALVIFEVYLDDEWTNLLSLFCHDNISDSINNFIPFNAVLFIFYLGSRLVEQFWYTTPNPFRYENETWKRNYNAMIWTGCVVEVVCLIVMIRNVYRRNQLPVPEGSSGVINGTSLAGSMSQVGMIDNPIKAHNKV